MPDIVDIVLDSQFRLQALLEALARAQSQSTLNWTWAELADALEIHVAAAAEICGIELPRHSPHASGGPSPADRYDVVEAVREGRLREPGSAAWSRALCAVRAASTAYFLRQQRDIQSLRATVEEGTRHRLGAQWSAYALAYASDIPGKRRYVPLADRSRLPAGHLLGIQDRPGGWRLG